MNLDKDLVFSFVGSYVCPDFIFMSPQLGKAEKTVPAWFSLKNKEAKKP
jgi:hypothetical protein